MNVAHGNDLARSNGQRLQAHRSSAESRHCDCMGFCFTGSHTLIADDPIADNFAR